MNVAKYKVFMVSKPFLDFVLFYLGLHQQKILNNIYIRAK